MQRSFSVEELIARGSMDDSPELRLLFHRLNNQLGIILAHAELLEAKATDETHRARAGQVVASALEAMGTAKEIRAFQNQLPAPNLSYLSQNIDDLAANYVK